MDKEILGLKEIISQLGDEELIGLTNTVTQGLLKNKLQSREDAIDAVIKYSPDSKSILKRKVITRDVLFSYLHDHNIPASLPISKEEIIQLLCSYWNAEKLQTHTINHMNLQQSTFENTNLPQSDSLDVNALAKKFTEWFYNMMNLNVPIGFEHFWSDSRLKLTLSTNREVTEEIVYSPPDISDKLYKTKTQYNLYFNPNCLQDGVRGHIEPHGLAAVLVCGTLHSNSVCVGVFEQCFMLARDPLSENNWKIKNTELHLKSKDNIQGPPKLCDSNLTKALL